MYTICDSKNSGLSLIVALTASISILVFGLLIQIKELENKPLITEQSLVSKEGFLVLNQGFINPSTTPNYHKPQISASDNTPKIKDVLFVELTGYSSTVDQTNSEPFITASGSWVRHGIVAANFLEFGTKIRIPEYFGDEIFVVKDRMNRRYSNPKNDLYDGYVDVWFSTRQEATNFGRVRSTIEVLE